MDEREEQFRKLAEEFPESPLGHFSLGKHYLDTNRAALAVASLERAVDRDPGYAAAWVALGDALGLINDADKARAAYARALETPLGRRDQSLQADVADRIAAL